MWGVGVGVTVEVLVAPDCPHGEAASKVWDHTLAAPCQQLKLIEQWSFKIQDKR